MISFMLPIVGPRIRFPSPGFRRALLLSVALGAASAWRLGFPADVGAADSAPFEILAHDITGLIRQVWDRWI